MESRLHAIPGIVKGPAVLPRSAPGLANCETDRVRGRGDELPSRQHHYPPGDVLDETAVMKWALATIDRVHVRGGAVRSASLARSAGGRRYGATFARHDLGRCSANVRVGGRAGGRRARWSWEPKDCGVRRGSVGADTGDRRRYDRSRHRAGASSWSRCLRERAELSRRWRTPGLRATRNPGARRKDQRSDNGLHRRR